MAFGQKGAMERHAVCLQGWSINLWGATWAQTQPMRIVSTHMAEKSIQQDFSSGGGSGTEGPERADLLMGRAWDWRGWEHSHCTRLYGVMFGAVGPAHG